MVEAIIPLEYEEARQADEQRPKYDFIDGFARHVREMTRMPSTKATPSSRPARALPTTDARVAVH